MTLTYFSAHLSLKNKQKHAAKGFTLNGQFLGSPQLPTIHLQVQLCLPTGMNPSLQPKRYQVITFFENCW